MIQKKKSAHFDTEKEAETLRRQRLCREVTKQSNFNACIITCMSLQIHIAKDIHQGAFTTVVSNLL